MSKDMNLVIDTATSSGIKLPAASAAQESFESGVLSSGDLDACRKWKEAAWEHFARV
jgi:3-hydroxyisobutyrate dehydrogenase-like beta-hydroxyacid dehydrogenase